MFRLSLSQSAYDADNSNAIQKVNFKFGFNALTMKLQWNPLNVITDNVVIQLM